MTEIWAIILAAGESKRMGTQKLLLPFMGKTVIENVIENVISSGIRNILVVAGSHYDEVIKTIGDLPVKVCYNPDYKQGMLSSVKCGISALPENYKAFLVFLGDQPMIPPKAVDLVVQAYKDSDKGIIMPVNEKRRGHPLLIDKRLHKEINKLEENEGLRALAYKFPEEVLEVETELTGILKDIDTQEEYQKLLTGEG